MNRDEKEKMRQYAIFFDLLWLGQLYTIKSSVIIGFGCNQILRFNSVNALLRGIGGSLSVFFVSRRRRVQIHGDFLPMQL